MENKTYTLIGADGKPFQSRTKGALGGHRKDKIYGTLNCAGAARWIAKGYYVKQRVFFADEQTAIAAGYRPCFECLREKYKEWKAKKKMLYKEWIDFTVYPSDANRVKTREERLNTQNAVQRWDNTELAKKVGFVVNWSDYSFTYDKDTFEAMWIDEDGNVTIWTEKRVWSLHRRIDGKEMMTYVPRHPDLSQLF